MARRTFDVVDVTEILIHWHAGRSISEVAASLGVDRKTIRKYLAPALAAGMAPGGPPLGAHEWAELVAGWFPQLVDTRLRQVTWPRIGAHHETIKQLLAAGVTQATIHQRLRDEHGLAASVASLRRYVAAMLPEDTCAAGRWWCCARRWRRVLRPRSTTAIWGPGSTQWVGGAGGCGRL
jgi:transposase